MNIVVLMAGEGKRFKDAGITTPKPFVEVNGKTIVEHTLDSLKSIDIHDSKKHTLTFAIQHDKGTHFRLNEMFGFDIYIRKFASLTRGNLETAWECTQDLDENVPLLVLDADNKYNDNKLISSINRALDFCETDNMGVCQFEPLDDSDKWAFAIPHATSGYVEHVVEKDATALEYDGKPLIGTFWFSSTKLFNDYAKFIIHHNLVSGPFLKEEFYMSRVPAMFAELGGKVWAHTVKDVVPLGTPEDVEKFRNGTV